LEWVSCCNVNSITFISPYTLDNLAPINLSRFLLSSQFLKCISEKTAKFWIEASQEELKNAIRLQKFNANVAKNVIIFLGKFLPLCVKANTMTKRSCAQFKANAVKDNTQFIEVKREKKTMVVFFASVR